MTDCAVPPMSLSHLHRERRLGLHWAFAASTRRVRFAPEIPGHFGCGLLGCISVARLGLAKLRGAVSGIPLTGHP